MAPRRSFIPLLVTAIIDAMLRLGILVGVCVLVRCAQGHAQQPVRAADSMPLCIYEGSSYSEGAYICAHASLVMACSVAGEHAVWKVVTDREISRLCAVPSRHARSHRSRHHVARRLSASTAPSIGPPASDSAKCFTFNGKRFCE
jgi:hypothetical protein